MSDGTLGRNESPGKMKFLFLSNNRVSVFNQDAPLNIQSKYCTLTLLVSSNYEFMFIPSDTKSWKNRGRYDNNG